MGKTDIECLQKLPTTETLKKGFSFIEDPVLLENIAITMQYIMFLLTIENNHTLPGSVGFTIMKDIIVHTGSILESMLWYALSKGIDKGKFTIEDLEIMDEKFKNYKTIHTLSDREEIGAVTKMKKFKDPKDAMLNDLIYASLRVKLIDKSLSEKLHEIKKDRNKIHLGTLSDVDDDYTNQEINEMFETVKELKTKIISFLT